MIEEIIIKQLDNNSDKEIFFWGASLFLENFLKNNKLDKYKIAGIIDSDESKRGKKLSNLSIYNFDEVLNRNDIKIVFTIRNNNSENYHKVYNKLKIIGKEGCLLPNVFIEFQNISIISNKIFIFDDFGNKTQVSYIKGLNIKWNGINSTVEIGCNPIPVFSNSEISIGSNDYVKIGSSPYNISNLGIQIQKDNSKVIIGNNFSCDNAYFWLTGEASKTITVGNDCMFSREIILRTSDYHAIFDKTTKELINKGGDITIGDHVWIAQKAMVLKKSNIPNGSIVSSNSLVNKKFNQDNIIIGGYPAKILKQNIEWSRSNIDAFL